ncbi:MAG: InlB B-repeat-containing protein, partial [Candidatus Phytoplasma sp.]|nr:InlB B-repeat-containing protein [Phytoplasma sp.]
AYILQAYKVTGVTITNLVFEGGDAALYVNGSEVTIENITLNDHEFGGIEVSQGKGVETTPKLTVIGQLESNLFELPYIWIDGKTTNDGWVILPTELALDEVEYTEAGKEQVWFIDQTVDETAPVLLEKTLQIIDGKLVLVIKAQDDNLYSLEVDHSLNTNEFTVYASEQDPYGGQQAAFKELDVVVVFADGTWTITFGNGAMDLIKSVTQLDEFKVHVVIKDHVGNAFGSMSPTTEENTVSINIYNLDLVEDGTTTNTVRLFAGELVVLPELEDKGELLFAGWFTDVELTNEYTEAAIESHLTLYAKFEEVAEEIVKEVLNSDFSEGKTSLTSLGWGQSGLGSDYKEGNPRLKFDSTGDWIKSPEFSLKKTASVTIFYKNNGITGAAKVEFFDQNDILIYTFNSFVGNGKSGNIVFEIDIDVTSIKIMYTKGSAGNLGVGSCLIEHNI